MIAYRDKDEHKDDAARYFGGISEVFLTPIENIETWEGSLEFALQQINLPGEITEDTDYEIIQPKQLPAPECPPKISQ